MEEEIATLIKQALPGAAVVVRDYVGGGDHFEIEVRAPQFKGKSITEQHQMVHEVLSAAIQNGRIHAVKLKTEVL